MSSRESLDVRIAAEMLDGCELPTRQRVGQLAGIPSLPVAARHIRIGAMCWTDDLAQPAEKRAR